MPSASPRPLLTALRTFGLAALWTLTAATMVWSDLSDPFDPTLEGTHRYGHNPEGALRDGLLASLVELAVLYLILRPWNPAERSWPRVLAALVPLLPWTLFSMLVTMHAGGIVAVHFFWLLAVVLVLVTSLAFSAMAAIERRLRLPP